MTSTRITVAFLAFLAAVAGALFLLRGSDGSTEGAQGGEAPSAARSTTSEIWQVGDRWVVNVSQDSGSITPDGEKSVAKVPYRFEVAEAPVAGDADSGWLVKVTQDGAEGPFADGWKLVYQERDGAMKLWRVGQGDLKLMEAELATIVLGMGFPYEVTITELPKPEATVSSAKLQARSALPPSADVPKTGNQGMAPP
ncbi:MAG: hypothetical protein JWO69_1056, partial [Thermoleophilia bacterium]|nr:hypothetical protein [Thermoleophilia bacterium]